MFIKETWYVVAWAHELDDGALVARTVAGVPVVLYRTRAGNVAALQDRCAHRFAPLSLGRREGDCIRCMYHGLKFDEQGVCTEIPGQASITPGMKVRRFPVVERFNWIWIWLGDEARADETLIPDCFSLDHPDWAYRPGYLHFDAGHRLISDNLLDFSHLAYVHPTTLGGGETASRPVVTRTPHGVRIERWLLDDEPAPFHQRIRAFEGKVDRWWFYDYVVPGILVMHSGVQAADTGAREGRYVDALQFRSCQAVAPESARTSHYFFAVPRDFALDDATVTATVFDNIAQAFEEDRRIIEAQQARIDDDPAARMMPIAADAALNHYRQVVERRLAEEAGT